MYLGQIPHNFDAKLAPINSLAIWHLFWPSPASAPEIGKLIHPFDEDNADAM